MKAWYNSEERFTQKIIRRWKKHGTNFNAGNIQFLKYSFRALVYWNQVQGKKVSQVNKINVDPKLF